LVINLAFVDIAEWSFPNKTIWAENLCCTLEVTEWERLQKLGDAKISPSILGVGSLLLSLNDGKVNNDRVEPVFVVDARLDDEFGLVPNLDWSIV
jgi:hypothetical protein